MTMIAERPETKSPAPEVANAKLLARAQMALDAHREGRLRFASSWGGWTQPLPHDDGKRVLYACALGALMVGEGPMDDSRFPGGFSIVDTLVDEGVSRYEAWLIEAAFEGFDRDLLAPPDRDRAHAFYLATGWEDKQGRGLAVMRNIVDNGGRFDPSAPPVTG